MILHFYLLAFISDLKIKNRGNFISFKHEHTICEVWAILKQWGEKNQISDIEFEWTDRIDNKELR